MKRFIASVMVTLIAATSLTACYGKMALTRKVYRINGEVRDKYLRSLVTWAFVIVPVYGVAALADFILFNTIEFWSGRNPVAQGEKEFLFAEAGERYRVHARKSGDVVHYNISRYGDGGLKDSLAIEWNLKDGGSTAVLTASGGTTRYAAQLENGAVQVVSSAGPVQAAALAR